MKQSWCKRLRHWFFMRRMWREYHLRVQRGEIPSSEQEQP